MFAYFISDHFKFAAVTPKNKQSIIVNLGGVIQDLTDDYSISGSTLEFTVPPISDCHFLRSFLVLHMII